MATAALLTAVACAGPGASAPTTGAQASVAAPSASAPEPAPTTAPPAFVAAEVRTARRWHTVPDAAFAEPVSVVATFAGDPAQGAPYARLGPREVELRPREPLVWTGEIPLTGIAPGEHAVEVRLRAVPGQPVAGSATVIVSQPQYAVWTLDFEGDTTSDASMATTAAIADTAGVPMVVMWNPRVWTTSAVAASRAAAMLAWTKARAARGDEVALHLHMWTDFVRAAGVTARVAPSWSGRGDGYDVPMYAYDERESRALLDHALRLMAEHGLARPTSFRAASYMVRSHNLRAIASAGFSADASVAPAGSVGSLRYPWALPADAQPYRPSPDDPGSAGSLPVLLSPTHLNTFGHTAASIAGAVATLRGMIAEEGAPAADRRTIHFVSHPSTINATERAAIERVLQALAPLRYDADRGPLRFVTLAQLARAYAP